MIRYILFSNKGSVKQGTGTAYPLPKDNQYLFLFLSDSDKDEIDKIASVTGLDKKPLLTFQKEKHSHIYLQEPSQFVVRTAYLHGDKAEFANLLFSVTPRFVIFASSTESPYHDMLIDTLFREMKNTPIQNALSIFCRFMRNDIEENYEVLNLTEERVKSLEAKAAKLETGSQIRSDDIIYMKSVLFKLSTQLWEMVRIISLLRIGIAKVKVDFESGRVLSDLQETLRHQAELALDQKEILSDTLNIYSAGASIRMMEKAHSTQVILKRLTAFSVILLAAELITTKFSTNTADIPFTAGMWSFEVVVGAIAVLMISTFAFAKKQQWV